MHYLRYNPLVKKWKEPTMTFLTVTTYMAHTWPQICSIGRNHNPVRPPCLNTGLVKGVTQRVPQVDQELLLLGCCGFLVALSIVFNTMFGHCGVLRLTASNYHIWYLQIFLACNYFTTDWKKRFIRVHDFEVHL